MTEKQLRERMVVSRASGHGQYRVVIVYRGKTYSCISNNTMAWDMKDYDYGCGMKRVYYSSARQAMQAFYDECKTKNNLR